ncbi:MAG: formyltransferase family protein [Caldilineaceae bacterium]
MVASQPDAPLRVVTFNVLPIAFQLVQQWAEQTGNKIVLAVTTPGPSTRRTPTYREVVAKAAPTADAPAIDVLVTTRLRRVALPLIRALQPDLIVSFSFPYRIPPEIRAVPRYGAVNLHPAPLPAYRGPNVMRLFYDGWPTFGATLHWTEDDFDTGNILSQHAAPLPDEVTPQTIMTRWPQLIMGAFAEGIAKACAGDPGAPQDHTQASYAAPFTEADYWLDWHESRRILQRKSTALNLMNAAQAKAHIEGQACSVEQIIPLPDAASDRAIGTLLERNGENVVIRVGDGQVAAVVRPLQSDSTLSQ